MREATRLRLLTWAQDELGCPGDECKKLQMSERACDGCPQYLEVEVNPESYSYLDYVEYLMDMYERLKLGLKTNMSGSDYRFTRTVMKETESFQNSILKRSRKLKKE